MAKKKAGNTDRMTGTIARIVTDRGFGFIKPDGERMVDHFFHVQGMAAESKNFSDLRVGDRVSFSPMVGEKGPRAQDVLTVEDNG